MGRAIILAATIAVLASPWTAVSQTPEEAPAATPASVEGAPATAASTPTPSDPAESVVTKLHDTLIETMKHAEELGYSGRFARIEHALKDVFDLDFMARKSVGRYWSKLSPEDQERWLRTFARMTAANYAGRFVGFDGQHFETVGRQPASHETVMVLTKLVQPNDDDIELNYRVREAGSKWRIIDVYMNGTVSELALRRSEYSSALKREGFEQLVASVDEKIADLEKAD